MLTQISCINYNIKLQGDNGNAFNIDKLCLEQDDVDGKIVSYVRFYLQIVQDNKSVPLELMCKLVEFKNWIYSLYSTGPLDSNRKHEVKYDMADGCYIQYKCISQDKGELTFVNTKEDINLCLQTTNNKVREFQSNLQKLISFI